MRYTSTRDGSLDFSFEDAVCSGYAPDGGLFVPKQLPQIGVESHLEPWSKLSYPKLAYTMLRLFVSHEELSDDDLIAICTSAFHGFSDPDCAVPLRKVGGVYIAELFHGPTFCFKDLGMRAVVNLLSHFATVRSRKTTLLVATTGDTGPAAVQAVSDINNPLLTIVVHYPQGQISDLQRKQLTTVVSPCVRVVAFEGGGDDMDLPIKRILTSQTEEERRHRILCGVNSYNIGRPLMQMVHYVWTYLRVAELVGVKVGDPNFKLDIVLPTGAMGNIAGGYMAKKMGVPLGLLCSGVNVNDITYRVMETGRYYRSESMHRTLSEAINVQMPYNFERLLYYLTGGNHVLVKDWMTTIDCTSKLDLDHHWLELLQNEFRASRVTDDEMCEVTRKVRDSYDYVVDPHTAVALAAAQALGYDIFDEDQKKTVAILATASPCKFQESVTAAIGENGWSQYVRDEFPDKAALVLEMEEVPPRVYPYQTGSTLLATQLVWESMARGIIKNL